MVVNISALIERTAYRKRVALISAFVLILPLFVSVLSVTASAEGQTAQIRAEKLYSLGLLKGNGTDADGKVVFLLNNQITRTEAVVMIIRLSGREAEALSTSCDLPFSDIKSDDWAAPYIAYAYKHGIASGVTANQFGRDASNIVSARQYVIFLLRALGYSDSSGDFSYSGALTFATSVGFSFNPDSIDGSFTRGDAITLSYEALTIPIKGSSSTLAKKLNFNIAEDTSDKAESSEMSAAGYTADAIKKQAGSAIFQILTYKEDGNLSLSGSGFFIDSSGVAVTSYHNISRTAKASVILGGLNKYTYPVSDVLYCDAVYDIAVIRVSKTPLNGERISAFPALTIAGSSPAAGDTVYTVGYPYGVELTVHKGFFMESGEFNHHSYDSSDVQTQPGNSGGALLDENGHIIGITSAIYENNKLLTLSKPASLLAKYDLTIKGEPYSLVSTTRDDQYILKASVDKVELTCGTKLQITISDVYFTGASYSCCSSSNYVSICSWVDSKMDPAGMKLFIIGNRNGQANITVVMCDAKGNTLASKNIKVSIT